MRLARVLILMLAGSFVMPGAGTLAADMDGDGLRDRFETRHGVTDAANPDSDGDGVIDAAEDSDGDRLGNLGEQRFGTHPGHRDSDADGLPDGREDGDRDGVDNARQQDRRPLPKGLSPALRWAAYDAPGERGACQTPNGSADVTSCELGPGGSANRVVLLGDSHAMMYLPALTPVLVERGWRLLTLIKSACPPVLGVHTADQRRIDDGRSCAAWRRNALTHLAADPPAHIVIAHSDSYRLVGADGHALAQGRRADAWRAGLRRTLAALPATSRVTVIGDVPTNVGNPVICLRQHKGDISACAAPRQLRGQRHIEVALRQAAASRGARFGTLYGKICTYDPCPLVHGNVLMWRDGGHLTMTFVDRLTPALRGIVDRTIGWPPAPAGAARPPIG